MRIPCCMVWSVFLLLIFVDSLSHALSLSLSLSLSHSLTPSLSHSLSLSLSISLSLSLSVYLDLSISIYLYLSLSISIYLPHSHVCLRERHALARVLTMTTSMSKDLSRPVAIVACNLPGSLLHCTSCPSDSDHLPCLRKFLCRTHSVSTSGASWRSECQRKRTLQ